jgi:hypothetical protein
LKAVISRSTRAGEAIFNLGDSKAKKRFQNRGTSTCWQTKRENERERQRGKERYETV